MAVIDYFSKLQKWKYLSGDRRKYTHKYCMKDFVCAKNYNLAKAYIAWQL